MNDGQKLISNYENVVEPFKLTHSHMTDDFAKIQLEYNIKSLTSVINNMKLINERYIT